MKIAIVRPPHAKNNTAFSPQVDIYEYLSNKYGADITIFADIQNKFKNDKLNVKEVHAIDGKIARFALHSLKLPYYHYKVPSTHLKKFDVIETSDPTFYTYSYYAYLTAKKYNIRLTTGSSITLPNLFNANKYIMLKLASKVIDYAFKVTNATPKAKERFVKLGFLKEDTKKSVIIGHPINTEIFKPMDIEKKSEITILSVGRLDYTKGHKFLIKAMAELIKETDVELLIAGVGKYKSNLVKLIKYYNLENSIKLLGLVPREKLPELYNKADIFALHSLSTPKWEEYFGVVLAEAMACGKPVISTRTGGIPYVVPDGKAGFLTEQKDIDELVSKLDLLINDSKLRRKMGQYGRKHVLENFKLEKLADRWYWEIYNA